MSKRVLIAILVFICVICICLVSVLCLTGGVSYLITSQSNSNTSIPILQSTTEFQIPETTGEATQTGNTPTPDAQSADIIAQMDQIESQVSHLRELPQLAPVDRQLISSDELRQKVEQDFFKDYTQQDVQNDQRTLSTFGLLEPGFDLYDLYVNLYSEQVAGYYDSETKQMYVIQEQGFGGPERTTYAHEFTHVLQDQHYDLQNGLKLSADDCKQDSERCAAVTALIEGDATLTEQYWLYTYGSDQDRQQLNDFYSNLESPVYDSAPEFLQKDLMFPYSQGLDFVGNFFTAGGYSKIDEIYQNPPVSTEMILHPEKYPDEKPISVKLPDLSSLLNRPLDKVEDGVLGEWYTYLVLADGRDTNARISDSEAQSAAAGWGGDAYTVYWDDKANLPVMVLDTVWDTANDAGEFANTFDQYAGVRWGDPDLSEPGDTAWVNTDDGAVALYVDGNETLWVIAPTIDDVTAIIADLTVPVSIGMP